MRKQTGNMYPWVTHTWNPITGRCPHECAYCYMRRFPLPALHLDEKVLRENLGSGNVIFVGSGTDMWAEDVPAEWITKVGEHLKLFPDNTYLFQTKNPERFYEFKDMFEGLNIIFGTTIETNRWYPQMGKAPGILNRIRNMSAITGRKMVTIEPVMDFDLETLVHLIKDFIRPAWVNIGADSKRSGLPEPGKEKTLELIEALKEFTEVKIKDNLRRIIG